MLTDKDIKRLNKARDILNDLESAARTNAYKPPEGVDGYDFGRLAEAANIAENAVFNVLNTANAYCLQDIPDGLLHNRKQVTS